jgi:hypothetical protein
LSHLRQALPEARSHPPGAILQELIFDLKLCSCVLYVNSFQLSGSRE